MLGLTGALTVLCALIATASASAATHPRLVRIGTAPVLPLGTQPLAAAASANQRLRVTVALAPRNASALGAYADAVSDPLSPDYHRYLSTAQFAARFGPSRATIDAVRAALDRAGLRVGALGANHLSLDVDAPTGTLERALHVQLAHVLLPSRVAALVNTQAPAVPASIARDIQAIVGLDGLQSMRSLRVSDEHSTGALARAAARAAAVRPRAVKHQPSACASASTAASQQGAYTANQVAGAYSFSPLYGAGDEGAGVTVGVYELEPNAASDIAAYQSCYGTDTSVTYVPVDGGAGSGDGSGEAAFDIEQLIGLAPKANLIVYQAPNSNSDTPGSGPFDLFSTMISQDKVQIISNSWGECEAVEGATDAHAENTLFEEAAIQGQTIVSAAGDDGSEDCLGASSVPNEALAVDDPGSQPFITDVGGTSMTALGPPPTEVVWNGGGSGLSPFMGSTGAGAGGGGISSIWSMPSYQSSAPASLNVINANSSGSQCGNSSGDCREVPDVSADADPAHGYLIYYNGNGAEAGQPAGWQSSGGTSGAAPLWAALFALTDADGACGGNPIGFVNPALYRLGAGGEGSDFHDVTSGENDFTDSHNGLYPAGSGYDMASGLGTPDATALAAGLCADSLKLSVPSSRVTFAGQSLNLHVGTSDASGVPVSVTVTGLPRGLSYDAASQTISGRPTVPGTYLVRVGATDADDAVRSASFVLDVAGRPTLGHQHLSGLRARRPALSLRVTAGRAESGLTALTLSLPAGFSVADRAKIVLRSLSTRRSIAHTVAAAGRRVVIKLATASPVYVQFPAGSLRDSTGLAREAARRTKPRLALSAVVKDQSGLVSTLRASLTPAN